MSDITEVQRKEGRGRCLIARKDISLGELILEAKPLCAVLEENQARSHCAKCFGKIDGGQGRGGSRCSACQSRGSGTVQGAARKLTGRIIDQNAKPGDPKSRVDRTPTRTLRLAGRILHSMNHVDGTDEESTHVREAVTELVHHNSERTPAQREQYRFMAAFVAQMCVAGSGKRALSWPSACGRGLIGLTDAAYAVMGKISCNVFSITEDVGASALGCGLYLEAAVANHSCSPNAAQTFDGLTLALRCTRPVAKGEEIMIGITELHRPTRVRQEALRASYFFECRCERCNYQGTFEEDQGLEGYACQNKSCSGVCANFNLATALPKDRTRHGIGEQGAVVKQTGCISCRACGDSRLAEEAERKLMAVRDHLERGKAVIRRGDGAEGRKCLEGALERAVCLHRGNWLLSEIYAELVSVCLELEDFDAAATYAQNGIRMHRTCMSSLLPYFAPWAYHLAIAGKLLLCVQREPSKAKPLLEEAFSVVKVTHGERHPLYREVRDLLHQASMGG